MKHATPAGLSRVETLLADLRKLEGIVEKKSGVFYRRSRAFLHFHEDGDDVFADVRLTEPEFERFRCTTKSEQRTLLQRVRQCLLQSVP